MTREATDRVRVWLLGAIAAAAIMLSAPLATTAEAQSKEPIRIGFGMALTGGLAGASRYLFVQYTGIEDGKAVEQFDKPGYRPILEPKEFATGKWKLYHAARGK